MWIKSRYHRGKVEGVVRRLAIKMGDAGAPMDSGVAYTYKDAKEVEGLTPSFQDWEKGFTVWFRSTTKPEDVRSFTFKSPTEAIDTINRIIVIVQMVKRNRDIAENELPREYKRLLLRAQDEINKVVKDLC